MPDIKTRVVAEKAVKAIDKSAIAAQRMKNAYVQAKEKAERSAPVDQEESPESYAADWISDKANTAAFEGVHQLDRQGRKGLETTKANIAKAKERFQRKRLIDPLKKKAGKGAAEPASPPVEVESSTRRNQRAANPVHRPAGAGRAIHGEQAPIKTVERAGRTVKQNARSTGQAVAKTTGRTVKSARNSVKTTEAMGRTAAKTAYQTAKASQRMARTVAATAKKGGGNLHGGGASDYHRDKGAGCRYCGGGLGGYGHAGGDLFDWPAGQLPLWNFLFRGGRRHRPDHAHGGTRDQPGL